MIHPSLRLQCNFNASPFIYFIERLIQKTKKLWNKLETTNTLRVNVVNRLHTVIAISSWCTMTASCVELNSTAEPKELVKGSKHNKKPAADGAVVM